uniref:POX domain-containing protein n=1 Tax=Aegilops tauschii subsp. strangulata TaxID=200361 RepID=A0A453AVJ8_AEGTS
MLPAFANSSCNCDFEMNQSLGWPLEPWRSNYSRQPCKQCPLFFLKENNFWGGTGSARHSGTGSMAMAGVVEEHGRSPCQSGTPTSHPPAVQRGNAPRQWGGVCDGSVGLAAVLSLSSRETPPVTVSSIAGDEGRYHLGATTAASQGQVVMNSKKYLRAAQELLDEVVSVSKDVDDVDAKARSAASVKKKEDSEGLSGGGGGEEDASGAKGGAPAPEISRQFRCLRDAIASQVRAASRALGEDCDAEGLGGGLGR